MFGAERAEFGNRDLKFRQDFEQERFELGIGAIDFVNQQNDGFVTTKSGEQRSSEQKVFREKRRFAATDDLCRFRDGEALRFSRDGIAKQLRVKHLPRVIPLVERFRFVESLVTLQAKKRPSESFCRGASEIRFADTGGTLEHQRPFHAQGEP